jgi:hypothetical protein
MAKGKKTEQILLQQLVVRAKSLNIEVRTEKLCREVGYHARSGRCRLNGQDLIIIDRDASLSDQVDFLTTALDGPRVSSPGSIPGPRK